MELTRKIIDDVREHSSLPKEIFCQRIKVITSGFYKEWLKDAEHLIEHGERVRTDKEILLIHFYEAVKIDPLKTEMNLVKGIKSIDDPEGNEWLKEISPVSESRLEKLEKLSEKLDKVRPMDKA